MSKPTKNVRFNPTVEAAENVLDEQGYIIGARVGRFQFQLNTMEPTKRDKQNNRDRRSSFPVERGSIAVVNDNLYTTSQEYRQAQQEQNSIARSNNARYDVLFENNMYERMGFVTKDDQTVFRSLKRARKNKERNQRYGSILEYDGDQGVYLLDQDEEEETFSFSTAIIAGAAALAMYYLYSSGVVAGKKRKSKKVKRRNSRGKSRRR